MPDRRLIAIVGAGSSGITATRQALDYGFEPVAFEVSKTFGGLWNYKPQETDGRLALFGHFVLFRGSFDSEKKQE
ncbi:unnamed protein product [Anisakis simplex]|uniref:Flavin-containing monooxygenase n=1 Tax=Anisakis simplex TaxID=6269 RepID=A0A0M3K1K4_ANISI|nr:unnamed protein product [Anisakis simplex]